MSEIVIRGARLHNLKNVTLTLPKNKLIVFSGLSGSGKSTMAFDSLHQEGQRQFMESLGMVAHVSKPAVDSISGLSPSISVDQRLTNHSPRSTVGTATEVFTYLRVLYARVGHRPCPRCGKDVPPEHEATYEGLWDDEGGLPEASLPEVVDLPDGAEAESAIAGGAVAEPAAGAPTGAPSGEENGWGACPHCGARLLQMNMAMFSFNKPDGACPTCTGLGTVYTAELDHLFDESKSIIDGGVVVWDIYSIQRYTDTLRNAGKHYGFEFDPALPIGKLGQVQRDLLLYGVRGKPFTHHFPNVEPPPTVFKGFFEGVVTNLLRRHAEHATDADYLEKIERYLSQQTCPDCHGARLRPEARVVTVTGRRLVAAAREAAREAAARGAGEVRGSSSFLDESGELPGTFDGAVSQMPLSALAEWVDGLQAALPGEDWSIAEPIVLDLRERVHRLVEVGLGYLTLERATPSLSAGEAQRLRLAALLGSGLTGVLYVLDEPTIGLHPKDTPRLVGMLKALRDLGNTVLVIEHDLEMIQSADWVVDFGPGAGRNGGQVVAQGTPEVVAKCAESHTGRYLSGTEKIAVPERRRRSDGRRLTIRGAREHNLKNITARIPLRAENGRAGMLVAVTGVSGSGKSSLMFDILDRAARQKYYGAAAAPGDHDGIEGWEHLDKIITIDQAPLGRSTRSNAATYTDAFTAIREVFAAQPEAKARGLAAQHFSFNVPGGRCERCEGSGTLSVEMHFLPDVLVRCPVCRGRRYKKEVLAVKYQGVDIAQVLDMTIEEALALFDKVPGAKSRLGLMVETGLGYLQLGQSASTFSGGEAQRVKLARELARRSTGRTLYLLDEPTTGLHPADIAHLLLLLQRLIEAGNTVVVIEHNLELIKVADWVIDLGPEGGAAGGEIIAEGTPEQIASVAESKTGEKLRGVLR